MQKKHQVFICSTFRDLEKQRQKLFIELYRNSFIPIGMEGFTPADQGQLDYIRERIDECDYFIIVVAHRFGTPSPASTIGESITEFEYNYAMAKGTVPISRFVIDDRAPWPGDEDHRSSGPDQARLIAFKQRLARKKGDFFDTNPWDDTNLVHKVITSVVAMRDRVPRPGLIRPTALNADADRYGIEEILSGLRNEDKEPLLVGHRKLWIIINDGYNFFEANAPHMTAALKAGTSVKILLVHPDSPCLEAIADKSDKSLKQQRREITRTIKFLSDQFGAFPGFRLLGHKQFNTYFGLINERECLIDFYFNFRLEHGRQEDRIALRCSMSQRGEPLHKKVSDDFENFWRETEARDDSDLAPFALNV